jgi:hypothetical protein
VSVRCEQRKESDCSSRWALVVACMGLQICRHEHEDSISPANAARSASSQRWWHVTVSSSTRSTPDTYSTPPSFCNLQYNRGSQLEFWWKFWWCWSDLLG